MCDNHYRQSLRAAARPREDRVCSYCGGTIDPSRRLRGPVCYCSRSCKEKAHIQSGGAAAATLRWYYRQYGLTPEQADEMRKAGCAICGTTDFTRSKHGNGHIDHCHTTGRVRGVLCTTCNTGLGQFKDDPALLLAAVRYLQG